MIPKLLLATRNRAKLREYSLFFQGAPFQLTTLTEEGIDLEVNESGHTMEDNARLKVMAYVGGNRYIIISDDSGLEVDALGGEPGLLSARYSGEGASDKDNISLLLSRLQGIPWERRSARFRCVIAIASSLRPVELCEGECRGIIAFEPSGDHGFGYDPVFYLPELGKTMAELSMEEKNRMSHRGEAARKALQALEDLWREFSE